MYMIHRNAKIWKRTKNWRGKENRAPLFYHIRSVPVGRLWSSMRIPPLNVSISCIQHASTKFKTFFFLCVDCCLLATRKSRKLVPFPILQVDTYYRCCLYFIFTSMRITRPHSLAVLVYFVTCFLFGPFRCCRKTTTGNSSGVLSVLISIYFFVFLLVWFCWRWIRSN